MCHGYEYVYLFDTRTVIPLCILNAKNAHFLEIKSGLKILVCVKDLTFHICGWRPFQADYLAAGENGSVQDKLPLALEHLVK